MVPAILLTLALGAAQAPPLREIPTPNLDRAQQHDREGWKRADARQWDKALEEFSAALQIFPEYPDALHGYGKSAMALQRYDQAAQAFERCRTVYLQGGSQDAERRAVETRARQDQIRVMKQRLDQLTTSNVTQVGNPVSSNEIMTLRQQIRDLEAIRDPGPMTAQSNGPVPAFISLSLGSAYFHLNRLADAERLFREALAANPRFGEAHNNLALVCVLTGRPDEAAQHVKLAEQSEFTVNPELKRMIRDAHGKG
jgi:protein O-GlcNAc transferase